MQFYMHQFYMHQKLVEGGLVNVVSGWAELETVRHEKRTRDQKLRTRDMLLSKDQRPETRDCCRDWKLETKAQRFEMRELSAIVNLSNILNCLRKKGLKPIASCKTQ